MPPVEPIGVPSGLTHQLPSPALAIAVAPNYGATVSQELIAIADASAGMILRKSLAEKLTGADMSHLPQGAGQTFNRNIITDS